MTGKGIACACIPRHELWHEDTIVHLLINVHHLVLVFHFREMAIKFNDYFEFPQEFDLAPYTAVTLAEAEGELSVWCSCCVHVVHVTRHFLLHASCKLNT